MPITATTTVRVERGYGGMFAKSVHHSSDSGHLDRSDPRNGSQGGSDGKRLIGSNGDGDVLITNLIHGIKKGKRGGYGKGG